MKLKNTVTKSETKKDERKNNDIISSNQPVIKKKQLSATLRHELDFISNIFNVSGRSQLKKNNSEEDEEEDFDGPILDIPETKIHKKQGAKKGANQTLKNKTFPLTLEGLEKELEELKGTPRTYQKTLRKKGLQARITKKKRKENLKQQKLLLKQGKTLSDLENGPKKVIKPVLNSDGDVVSNKFDFAESNTKKENKRKRNDDSISKPDKILKTSISSKNKLSSSSISDNSTDSKPNLSLIANDTPTLNGILSKTSKANNKSGNKVAFDLPNVKQENKDGVSTEENKTVSSGPVFNRDNKMMFSKIDLPVLQNKKFKKKVEKDPSKLLQKLKEKKKELSELQKEDKEKANTIKEKEKWSAALKRAGGEKVRDDPELLRKSISKERNMKERSKKKWQARTERVQKEKDDRQKKRQDNIQARKSDKKKRKMKKAIKKGSYVQV